MDATRMVTIQGSITICMSRSGDHRGSVNQRASPSTQVSQSMMPNGLDSNWIRYVPKCRTQGEQQMHAEHFTFDSKHTTRVFLCLCLCLSACLCRDHAFGLHSNADTPTRAAFHFLRNFAGVQHDEIREKGRGRNPRY